MANLAADLNLETLAALHDWLAQLKTCKADECRTIEMAVPEIKY